MTAIEFNNVSKQYRLGLVSTGTLCHDINRWWQTKILHHEDPYLKIGETNDRTTKGSSDYVWALRDIDFKVEQGDVVGIIGRNGAGKSTLLKLLSRVTSPTTGSIRARGRIASLLEVGTGFHPEMTGRENIYMNGSIMGMTKHEIDRKLDEIVDFSGCERYLDTPVKRYSSGMSVRLGFAIAAHLEPEILVVDEVLAVGDAEFQKKAIGKMQDVAQGQGRTVLFVSHNMGAVKNLCKTGLVLKNGMVDFTGTAEEAINQYMSTSIVDFKRNLIVSNENRVKNNMQEISFEEITLVNDPSGIATDEPLEFLIRLHRNNKNITKFRITATIDDDADIRALGYVTSYFNVPDKDYFTIRMTLLNHSLTPRRYKVDMAIGLKDYDSGVRHFDHVKEAISFEIKYINKDTRLEYINWSRGLGAIMHQDVNSVLELAK